ncbi:M20/M25/M40 family metallo-hydrolase, partial [Christensenellaceae bacterium OttesenSCG-928-L17]|nr:M20/M25/M40 family metallo-hydrolase [Christensenellaceae bacterium OttesenSCG-928-L17]
EQHVQRVEEAVQSACAQFGATCEIRREDAFGVLHVPETSPLVARLKKVYGALGVEMEIIRTYGGSDATWLFYNGIDALNIGTGMQNAHALSEYIAIKDLEITTLAVERLMQAD